MDIPENLWDWYAGQALAGLASRDTNIKTDVEDAAALADGMTAERAKRFGPTAEKPKPTDPARMRSDWHTFPPEVREVLSAVQTWVDAKDASGGWVGKDQDAYEVVKDALTTYLKPT